MGRIIAFPLGASLQNKGLQQNRLEQSADVISALASELINTALWTVITTGIVNGCYLQQRIVTPTFLEGCLPPSPVISRGSAKDLADIEEYSALISRAADFYKYVDVAKIALSTDLHDRKIGRRRDQIERLSVCDLWQGAAAAALITLYHLDDVEYLRGVAELTDRLPPLCEALILARDGGQPFAKDGLPSLPNWAEKRMSRRFLLNMPARLNRCGNSSHILVVDVSLRGMGLDFVERANAGDLVSLELQNGRRFIGTVVWSQNRKAGLKFRRPLRPTDPLLSG